jgi:hypothetical protein
MIKKYILIVNMNSNKVQVITGFIVTIIIIGVILAIYFSTRAKKGVTVSVEEKVPNISISGANIAKKTETYMLMTEYYNLPELSKQITLNTTINITDSYLIETLKIKRTNGTFVYEEDLINISDGAQTVSFEALDGENMASTHTIEVFYTTYVSGSQILGASGTISISEDKLSVAAGESDSISLNVSQPLTTVSKITTNYAVIKFNGTNIFPDKAVYFTPVSTTTNGFKIMGTGTTIIEGRTFYIYAAGNMKMIATEATESANTEFLTYISGVFTLSTKKISFQNKLFDISYGAAVGFDPYTYYEEGMPSWSTCTGDISVMITHCTKSTNCGAIGRMQNGCWHVLKGDSLPTVSDTAFYTKYGTVLEKKNDFKLFYGGDGALGRDGRNACNMTDADREDACYKDDELQLIASGNTCGHKYYGTDKGLGSKLPTAYTNQYLCPRAAQFNTGDKISLKGGHEGKYCSDRPETGKLMCTADNIQDWEQFTVSKNADNTYALKSARTGNYCGDGGDNGVDCSRANLAAHEKFKIFGNADGSYSLKGGYLGKYCSDRPHGGGIICSVDHLDAWEKFTISKI